MASRQPRSAAQRRATARMRVARRRQSGQPRRAKRRTIRLSAAQLQALQNGQRIRLR